MGFIMNVEKQKHYFSTSGVQNLKNDIDLVFAIGAEIKLLKKSTRFFGCCPLHNDKDYSLVISPNARLRALYGNPES